MSENTVVQDSVVIRRQFDAPRELVWKMWTDPGHFAQWYGPFDYTVPVVEMDLRVGGSYLICLERLAPEGPSKLWFAGTYLEIVENERLVYTDYLSDETGRALTDPSGGDSQEPPHVTEFLVEFQDASTGTTLVVTQKNTPSDSPAADAWKTQLDKLQAAIETLPR